MLRNELALIVEQDRLVRARVVPMPMERRWCIDLLVKDPMLPGSHTEIFESDDARARASKEAIERFETLDDAARLLGSLGIIEFEVDSRDSVSFVDARAVPAAPAGDEMRHEAA